jgi:alpha-D-ribose 1-methylphosphonate 5-triphosphate diphosphatase PhnM
MRDEAKFRNEAIFREVNEQIEAVSKSVAPDDQTMEFLCECDRADCHEKLKVTRAEYESVRAVPTHFIVLTGHDDPEVEHVTLSNDRFLVVEKEGDAAEEAAASDPRD